jgi:hypothetical protein
MKLFDAITDFVGIVGLILVFLFGACGARAATTTKHSNSLGFVQYDANPYTYKAGAVSVSGIIESSINFRLQPLGTFGLFTEDILLCDKQHVAALFEGKHNPLLLTYKTRASRSIQGVGCHELLRVDELPTPEVK